MLEMRKIGECDMDSFCTLDNGEKTIAILADRWWPRKAKQGGIKVGKTFFMSYIGNKCNERPNVGGVSIMSTNDVPSRKGCVV